MTQQIDWQTLMNKLDEIISSNVHENVDKYRHSILDLLTGYESDDNHFKDYVHYDESGYTKNLVKEIGQNVANVIVMCWAPRQESAFHAHENSKCFVKVLSGQLVEQQVAYPRAQGDQSGHETSPGRLLNRNDVSYIDDSIGVHKVSNRSDSLPAITLHIYTPPYRKCRIFTPTTTTTTSKSSTLSTDQSQVVDVTFFTKFGNKSGTECAN